MSENQSDRSLADDVLRGCAAIAAYIGLDQRQTFHALQRGYLPAQKEGKTWVALKSRLTQHYRGEREVGTV
jgi:hypothetical protein